MESLVYSEHKYGDASYLQTLGIWDFKPESLGGNDDGEGKYWLVFIHGGVWRDPTKDLQIIKPTISKLLEPSSSARNRIAGFASLNYRLSPHPSYPQDPATTPATELRAARHPEHIADVVSGLERLAVLRPSLAAGGSASGSQGYVLFGHSCGAFMAFQLLMGPPAGVPAPADLPFPAPTAIVGFDGIYDLRGLASRKGPDYPPLWSPAFGEDLAFWDALSPAYFRAFDESWAAAAASAASTSSGGGVKRRLAVVAHSPEDELVDMDETLAMDRALRESGVQTLLFTDLKGLHDQVWGDGIYTARVLVQTLDVLKALAETLDCDEAK